MNITRILSFFLPKHFVFHVLVTQLNFTSFNPCTYCKDRFIPTKLECCIKRFHTKGMFAHARYVHHIFALGTNQKFHTFCPISNFTLKRKLSSLSALSETKMKWKHSFGTKQSRFWEVKLFFPHYFGGILFLHCYRKGFGPNIMWHMTSFF